MLFWHLNFLFCSLLANKEANDKQTISDSGLSFSTFISPGTHTFVESLEHSDPATSCLCHSFYLISIINIKMHQFLRSLVFFSFMIILFMFMHCKADTGKFYAFLLLTIFIYFKMPFYSTIATHSWGQLVECCWREPSRY